MVTQLDTQLSGNHATEISYAERHTTGLDSIGAGAGTLPGLPEDLSSSDIEQLSAADIRKLSKVLFARLDELEEGTPEYSYVRNSLVELNLNLVHFAARQLGSRAESFEDVVQVGTIGLIKAINRFELHRGVEFATFALPTIRGEIKRFFRDTTWAVRVPRRLQELRLDLSKATTVLEQANGRTPTTAELAAHLGLDEAEVREGQTAANGYTASSLDQPNDGPDTDDTLADRIGYLDPELAKVENLHTLRPLIAALSARDRKILALRFVAERTQSEIGRELGVSQMQVSRLLTRILTGLRAQLTSTR
ncbi:SigB/SigF/SigG family RNA polymerase sigma factor [Streptomyces sp. TRM66268-LWL]|uniref:SigB/SigF/SigG family RNA polymerase sigma factor n=1 Tax=Streptomyces polyasparticus TaxID=2767826 RepID=A0ABR7SJK8_9ACTN|nr:SigB/SigF/SigG family RNA polymerase sigma factor [Streptomyces polyasparticus]MBC9714777.1 SigB/SigF/SigG family RNA polymerase sigma factor [Streptomyces polyasparticus]